MSDIHSNAKQHAANDSGPGYGLPNKAAPLPRQWQLPPPLTPAQRSQGGIQHFHAGLESGDNWQQAAPSRRMERATLLGLWLLVTFAAIAIALRVLDLQAPSSARADPARPLVSAGTADTMRSAGLVGGSGKDSDPFDDPFEDPVLPSPPSSSTTLPAKAMSPVPASAPMAAPSPATAQVSSKPIARLSAASTLTIDPATATMPEAQAGQASNRPACAEALQALQLCPDKR